MKDPYGINLRSAPPTGGVAPALQAPGGGRGDHPPAGSLKRNLALTPRVC